MGMLGRLRKNLTVGAANTLYKSLIDPIFDYCDSVWSCCNKCDADGLEPPTSSSQNCIYVKFK